MYIGSREERLCTVCGGPGAAYHYQGMVCQSCRVFFVRTIRRKAALPCRNGDNKCEIIAAFRANCTACRFQKCLEAKMKVEDVGKVTAAHIRRAVVRYLSRNDYIVKIKEIQANFGALGCQMLSRLQGTSLGDFLNHMINFERNITNLEGTVPTGSQINPSIGLAEMLTNPEASAPRSTAAWKTCLAKKSEEEEDYSIIHMYTRFCVAIADFLGSVLEYHQLSTLDKVKLAQYHIGHIGALDCVFYQYKFGVGTPSCTSKTEEFSLSEKEQAIWNERCISATAYFQAATAIFKEIVITHEEIILLKLLMIFFHPENLSDDGKEICRKARGRYQMMLAKYVMDEYPLMNKSEQLARITRIMDLFPIMKNLSEDSGQKYVIIINKNIGGMRQQLPYDVRIKVYT